MKKAPFNVRFTNVYEKSHRHRKAATSHLRAGGGILFGTLNPLFAVFNFEVSGVQTQIVGSTAAVTGSGSNSNFGSNVQVGDFAVFDIDAVNSGDNSRFDFADLRVTYTADNGIAGSKVMIARTVNSQGLQDAGTLSILVEVQSDGGSAELTFDWFNPGSFAGGVEQSGSSLISTRINYTTFDEPTTAAQFLTINSIASHSIEVGKQSSGGNALFMFEFRDPSEIVTFDDPTTTPVPEPNSFGIVAGSFALMYLIASRRRARI